MNSKLLVYVVLFFLLSVPIQGYANLKVTAARCHDNGVFSINVQNRYDDSLVLNDVNMTLFHPKLGHFKPKGAWDKDFIYLDTTHSQLAEFISTPGNTNISGFYDGFITYSGCKHPPCTEVFRLTTCPDFNYACELSKLEITNCFHRGQQFWVQFRGLNTGQYEKLNPHTDLTYYVESTERTQKKIKRFEGMDLLPKGKDTFLLKIPTKGSEQIYSFGVGIDKCVYQNNLLKEPVWCRVAQQESVKQDIGLYNESEMKQIEQQRQASQTPANFTEVPKTNYTEVPKIDYQTIPVEKDEERSLLWLFILIGIAWFAAILIIVYFLVREYF